MARLVYACRFEIPSTDGSLPILAAYSEWINRHYRNRLGLVDLTVDCAREGETAALPDGHRLGVIRHVVDDSSATLIDWTHPAMGDDTLRWRNDVRIGDLRTLSSVEHLISVESVDYQVSPARILLGSPSVVRTLCSERTVRVGDMQVRATPYTIEGIDDFEILINSRLRRLPLVVLAPYADGSPNLLDSEIMAGRLAGVAVVIRAADPGTTWEIAERFGRTLSCFDGGARIYWPNFAPSDDPRRHPLYLGRTIQTVGALPTAQSIEQKIFATAAFRFVPDPRISEIVHNSEAAQRAMQLQNHRESSESDWESYAIELDNQLTALKTHLFNVEAENNNLRLNQSFMSISRLQDSNEDEVRPEQISVPDSNRAAVELAKSNFRNLEILQSAVDSAERSPFQRPAELLEALADLDQVAKEWTAQKTEQGRGGDLRNLLIERGWGKRCSMHISDITRNKYKSSYTFNYNGNRVLFEPHITIGSGDANNCASIHFILDDDLGKIVVGHAGRHLPNTKA